LAQNHLIFEEIQLQDASICMEIGETLLNQLCKRLILNTEY